MKENKEEKYNSIDWIIRDLMIEINKLKSKLTFLYVIVTIFIFTMLAQSILAAEPEEYQFVKCPNDNNTYPEGTNCDSGDDDESDSQIIKEESEDYEKYKEKTNWHDDDESER